MISVIIPVYNGEPHVDRICRIFAAQVYQDFEIIFVNDGSTDQTLKELLYWQGAAALSIKVVDQPNQGVSAARNAGIDAASGVYLCFIDVDDTPLPEYLSDMLAVLTNEQVDLVFCKLRIADLPGGAWAHPSDTGRIRRVDKLSCLRDYLYGRLVSGSCTLMIRSEVVAANELRFADAYRYSEDLHFVWRAIACCDWVAYLDQTLYLYTLQSGSAMSRFTEDRFHGYKLMQDLEPYFDRTVPTFAREYRRYAAARIVWSIAWQSAIYNRKEEYIDLIREHHMRDDIVKLATFHNPRVAASSLVFAVTPRLFRHFVRWIGSPIIDARRDGLEVS